MEKAVQDVLQKVLGAYVRGFDEGGISFSLWNGEVRLNNLELKPEALAGLKMPVEIVGAFVGELRVEIPWRSFFGQPMVLTLDRLYLVVSGITNADSAFDAEKEKAKALKAKKAQIAAWQALEDKREKPVKGKPGTTLIDKLVRVCVRVGVVGGACVGVAAPARRPSPPPHPSPPPPHPPTPLRRPRSSSPR